MFRFTLMGMDVNFYKNYCEMSCLRIQLKFKAYVLTQRIQRRAISIETFKVSPNSLARFFFFFSLSKLSLDWKQIILTKFPWKGSWLINFNFQTCHVFFLLQFLKSSNCSSKAIGGYGPVCFFSIHTAIN